MLPDRLIFVLSLAGFVAFWWGLAALKGNPRIVPAPPEVLAELWSEAASGRLAQHLGATLWRVAIAFGLSMLLGTVPGVALGRMPRLKRWADPWVTSFLNLPAVDYRAVLSVGWPERDGGDPCRHAEQDGDGACHHARRRPHALARPADLTRAFALPRGRWLRHILLPQLAPYTAISARSGLAIIWKIVLVAEFLGRSSGIGFQIHLKFQMFDIAGVLVSALAFVTVMLAIDMAVVQPTERRANRWRR
jgi:NitT/TauT family transport system permease protein